MVIFAALPLGDLLAAVLVPRGNDKLKFGVVLQVSKVQTPLPNVALGPGQLKSVLRVPGPQCFTISNQLNFLPKLRLVVHLELYTRHGNLFNFGLLTSNSFI